jgi:HAD superfamily phosphatase (TIGR01668 family)
MIHKLLKLKQFIPHEFHQTVYEIDLEQLQKQGIKLILSDLDNTLISYDEDVPSQENIDFLKKVKELGFELVLVSNNRPHRIKTYTNELTKEGFQIKGFANARKPLNIGLKKAYKSATEVYPKEEVVVIGDQLLTDIWGANRFDAYSILVNPIKKKTEKWYTKINRKTEVKMIERIKNELPDTFNRLGLEKRI